MKMKKNYSIVTDIKWNPFSCLLALPALVYALIFGYGTLP
jgi:ABC-type polysaccharide transport system permease subunit